MCLARLILSEDKPTNDVDDDDDDDDVVDVVVVVDVMLMMMRPRMMMATMMCPKCRYPAFIHKYDLPCAS